MSVNIIYNKANTFGLSDDVTVLQNVLKNYKVKTSDMREPLPYSDVNIHLEIPVFSAIPWANTNLLLVNHERWVSAYDAYLHAFDGLIFRDPVSADEFSVKHPVPNVYVVPWCNSWDSLDSLDTCDKKNEFVCFIAGSTSKYNYLKQILPHWTEQLTIYTTRNDFMDLKQFSNVIVKCEDLDVKTRRQIMAQYKGHLVCSESESFGYAAANAETVGAFAIMNELPVFTYYYNNSVAWLSNEYTDSIARPTSNIKKELESAFDAFKLFNKRERVERFDKTRDTFISIMNRFKQDKQDKLVRPPILLPENCPPISIVTPTYNREKFIEIAFHNLLATDYPHDKIEWIVIEDNEDRTKMYSEKIISFQIQVPNIKLKYIPIEGRMSIGEKRNHAIENAANDIILFMDDDDHYPVTSFRRRVAWLLHKNISCCTTIAMYDLQFGTSAVNVPPFDIPLSQRISEATLTFRKSAWLERKFSDVSIAEGEAWIAGREDQVIEMPPQQIIVAFSHNNNKSSRTIPSGKPSCFWGFPKEYLTFIHGLAGVEIDN